MAPLRKMGPMVRHTRYLERVHFTSGIELEREYLHDERILMERVEVELDSPRIANDFED